MECNVNNRSGLGKPKINRISEETVVSLIALIEMQRRFSIKIIAVRFLLFVQCAHELHECVFRTVKLIAMKH